MLSRSGKEWKLAFAVYWSPKDYEMIQKLNLLGMNLKASEVMEIVFQAREMREADSFKWFGIGSIGTLWLSLLFL